MRVNSFTFLYDIQNRDAAAQQPRKNNYRNSSVGHPFTIYINNYKENKDSFTRIEPAPMNIWKDKAQTEAASSVYSG